MNKLSNEERALFQIKHWNAQIKAGDKEYKFIKDAVERQIPQTPNEYDRVWGYYECPTCGKAISCDDELEEHHYCLNCGQAIEFDKRREEYH